LWNEKKKKKKKEPLFGMIVSVLLRETDSSPFSVLMCRDTHAEEMGLLLDSSSSSPSETSFFSLSQNLKRIKYCKLVLFLTTL
jgi:hypothetical protein